MSPRCDQWGKGHHSEPWVRLTERASPHCLLVIPAAQSRHVAATAGGSADMKLPKQPTPRVSNPCAPGTVQANVGASCVSGKNCCYHFRDDVGRSTAPVWGQVPRRDTTQHLAQYVWGTQQLPTPVGKGWHQSRSLCRGGSELASRAEHVLHFTFLVSSVP